MENTTKNILVATGTGLAVGALIGVLFAPAKGKDTRAAIKNKVTDLKENVAAMDVPEMISDLKGKIESKFQDHKSDVKDELLERIQQLENAIEKA